MNSLIWRKIKTQGLLCSNWRQTRSRKKHLQPQVGNEVKITLHSIKKLCSKKHTSSGSHNYLINQERMTQPNKWSKSIQQKLKSGSNRFSPEKRYFFWICCWICKILPQPWGKWHNVIMTVFTVSRAWPRVTDPLLPQSCTPQLPETMVQWLLAYRCVCNGLCIEIRFKLLCQRQLRSINNAVCNRDSRGNQVADGWHGNPCRKRLRWFHGKQRVARKNRP